MEQRTGEKSAERIAIEVGAPIIKAAGSWQELHQALAKDGMRYERVGSGAVLFVNEVGVKASRADREASMGKLEKRLGAFTPSAKQKVVERAPEPVQRDMPGWQQYIAQRRRHGEERTAAVAALKQRQEAETKKLRGQQRREREEVLEGHWTGRGALRNVLESLLAAQRAVALAELRERQRRERAKLREQYRPYPDLEQWLRQQAHPELAEQWRYRASEVQQIRGQDARPATPRDIRDFTPEVRGGEVRYARRDLTQHGAEAAFVDRGGEIDVYAWRERASVLAALQLAEQKWEGFEVSGRSQFKALCVELAVEHGFKLSNPELREAMAQERQRQLEVRALPGDIEPSPQPRPSRAGTREGAAAPLPGIEVKLPPGYEDTARAYATHYRDVLLRQGGRAVDPSRVDAMIAVRMQATGHTQQAVEVVLQHCSPLLRQDREERNWEHYAKRTVDYAFGAAGQRQAEELKRYWRQWQKLEGQRELQRERDHSPSMSR
jgi:hypothetical protein